MIRSVLFFAVLHAGTSLLSQENIEILQLSGRYGTPAGFDSGDTEGSVSEWGSVNSLTAGIRFSERTTLGFNINHFYFRLSGNGEPPFPEEIAHPVTLHGVILRAGLVQKVGESGTLQVLAAPRVMSDFRNLDRNSLMMGGLVSWKKRYHERLSLGFGALYNTELFGPYLVPFLDIDWRPGSRWRIAGLVPITARVEYSISDGTTAGFNHFGLITTYALGEEEYRGDYMERQSIDLSLFIRQRVAGPLYAELMAGRTVGRRYHQYAGDQKVAFAIPLVAFGDERQVRTERTAAGDSWILTGKLVVSIPLPG